MKRVSPAQNSVEFGGGIASREAGWRRGKIAQGGFSSRPERPLKSTGGAHFSGERKSEWRRRVWCYGISVGWLLRRDEQGVFQVVLLLFTSKSMQYTEYIYERVYTLSLHERNIISTSTTLLSRLLSSTFQTV